MFSLDIQKNVKKLTTKTTAASALTAILTPLTYIGLPTIMKLEGWPAWWVGTGATIATGILFDVPGMIPGGLAAGAVHLAYSYGKDDMVNMLGRAPWNFQATSGTIDPYAVSKVDGLHGYYNPYGMQGLAAAQQVMLPDGRTVTAYEPSEMPISTPQLNGYYQTPPVAAPQLNGYYDPAQSVALMDDDPFGSFGMEM